MLVYDLVNPDTGNTYKQDNLELKHNIPLGALVEVKFDQWLGDGACWKVHARLWVVKHTRDCDGTPLYSLCVRKRDWLHYLQVESLSFHGFTEDRLKPIELTPAVIDGNDVPEW